MINQFLAEQPDDEVSAAAERLSATGPSSMRRHAVLSYLSRRALTGKVESRALLRDVCRMGAGALGATHAHILEPLNDGCTLTARATSGWPPEHLAGWRMTVPADSRLGRALRAGTPMLCRRPPPGASSGDPTDLLEQFGMTVGAVVMIGRQERRALLGLYWDHERHVTHEELQFARLLGQIAESILRRDEELRATRDAREQSAAAQAALLRLVVDRLRPALRESVSTLWRFRTNKVGSFGIRRAVRETEHRIASIAAFLDDLSLLADVLGGADLQRRVVPLNALALSSVYQVRDTPAAGGVTIRPRLPEEDVRVLADGESLRRVFATLCALMAEATIEGGLVEVFVRADEEAAIFAVRSSCATDGAESTLEPLTRDHDPYSFRQGPGLRLQLARALLSAHGGTVTLEPGLHGVLEVCARIPHLVPSEEKRYL